MKRKHNRSAAPDEALRFFRRHFADSVEATQLAEAEQWALDRGYAFIIEPSDPEAECPQAVRVLMVADSQVIDADACTADDEVALRLTAAYMARRIQRHLEGRPAANPHNDLIDDRLRWYDQSRPQPHGLRGRNHAEMRLFSRLLHP